MFQRTFTVTSMNSTLISLQNVIIKECKFSNTVLFLQNQIQINEQIISLEKIGLVFKDSLAGLTI